MFHKKTDLANFLHKLQVQYPQIFLQIAEKQQRNKFNCFFPIQNQKIEILTFKNFIDN